MPAPRLSHSAEAARAAALQAEFNEKKWVWVPDEKEGYLAGWVNKEEEDIGEIIMAAGGDIRKVPLYALSKMNPPKFDRVDDIADLTFLNEASVVHNLRLRYGSGAIYVSSLRVAVSFHPCLCFHRHIRVCSWWPLTLTRRSHFILMQLYNNTVTSGGTRIRPTSSPSQSAHG